MTHKSGAFFNKWSRCEMLRINGTKIKEWEVDDHDDWS